jgi:pimeloyl-ACP methyl ester carboxylesterase
MARVTVGEENGAPIELYYEDRGSGRPVVLVHGWPLSGRSWENQVPALVEAGYRVITYDRRGFGASSQTWDGYDYDTFVSDLHHLIEHLDLVDATLVGFSMGGGEVARYIGTYGGSERVTRAVFASAIPPFLYKSAEHPEGAIDAATLSAFHDGIRTDRVAFTDGFVTNFFNVRGRTDLVSQQVHDYNQAIAAFASPKGTLDCTTAFTKTDFRGDLARFTLPTLIIHGDADAIVPIDSAGKLSAELIPNSKLVVLKDAPHGCNVTHADEFNAELLAFLRS